MGKSFTPATHNVTVTHYKSIQVKITDCSFSAAYVHNTQICYLCIATSIVWKGGKGYSNAYTDCMTCYPHYSNTRALVQLRLFVQRANAHFWYMHVFSRIHEKFFHFFPWTSKSLDASYLQSQLKSEERNFTSSIKIKWRKISRFIPHLELTPKDL